jgi:dihydrodipicolinate synthase/N-acetylneuraminate lyase
MLGLIENRLRLPLVPLLDAHRAAVADALRDAGTAVAAAAGARS